MSAPFLGSTSGLSHQRLRARRYRRLSRDLYVVRDDVMRDDVDSEPPYPVRVEAAVLALPGAIPCLQSAAALLHLPVRTDGIIHVARAPGSARSERADVRVHRYVVPERERLTLGRLVVTAGPRTFVDLAATLSLEELVAVGDVVLRRHGSAQLEDAVARAAGRRGALAARRALALSDPGACSPAETRARLRLHRAGFTALRHGVVVRDSAGGWLAEPDLADTTARVAVQHDGAVHLTGSVSQRRQDLMRDELTREQDWQVVVLTAVEDRHEHLLVARVTDAYRRTALIHGRAVLPPHLR